MGSIVMCFGVSEYQRFENSPRTYLYPSNRWIPLMGTDRFSSGYQCRCGWYCRQYSCVFIVNSVWYYYCYDHPYNNDHTIFLVFQFCVVKTIRLSQVTMTIMYTSMISFKQIACRLTLHLSLLYRHNQHHCYDNQQSMNLGME